MNRPWRALSPGDNVPTEIDAAIEIPLHSNVKYELDKNSGGVRLDHVLYSAVFCPANYGFIVTVPNATFLRSAFESHDDFRLHFP